MRILLLTLNELHGQAAAAQLAPDKVKSFTNPELLLYELWNRRISETGYAPEDLLVIEEPNEYALPIIIDAMHAMIPRIGLMFTRTHKGLDNFYRRAFQREPNHELTVGRAQVLYIPTIFGRFAEDMKTFGHDSESIILPDWKQIADELLKSKV